MERRVHPVPFRTRKLSASSPMILHIHVWERRPGPTILTKASRSQKAGGFYFTPHTTPRPSIFSQFRRLLNLPETPKRTDSVNFFALSSLRPLSKNVRTAPRPIFLSLPQGVREKLFLGNFYAKIPQVCPLWRYMLPWHMRSTYHSGDPHAA